MSQDLPKICPSCSKKDITSFSTCRFCGTKYDAIIRKNNINIDERTIGIITLVLLSLGGIFYGGQALKSMRAQRTASISKSVQAANKPRMIEFYATWCGPCRAYGPIVEQCQAKYSGQIDFQRLDLDNPNNSELRRTFGVNAVPTTYLFNRKGEEVFEQAGGLDFVTLDKYLHDLTKE